MINIEYNWIEKLIASSVFFFYYRLTISAICDVNLRKYPLDTQTCNLQIESCNYELFLICALVKILSITNIIYFSHYIIEAYFYLFISQAVYDVFSN